MKSPIFLFSLPRSGSTLLQRILMTHDEIASVAEPWLLLPLVYSYRKEGILSEYSHKTSHIALEDFISNLPNKEEDYFTALRTMTKELYEKACFNGERYFLDKTPRYYSIIPEIAKIYPNAKFIFLFRNPVHVMSSMIQTWCNGRFNQMYSFNRDLSYGLESLTTGYKILKDKAYTINYEDFVRNTEKYTIEICNYLNISFREKMINDFSNKKTNGRMGDPTGVREYQKVETTSLEKWKLTYKTNYRKNILKEYVKKIDEETLKTQGYSKNTILEEIDKLDTKFSVSIQDRMDLFYSNLVQLLKPNIWLGANSEKWTKNRFLS